MHWCGTNNGTHTHTQITQQKTRGHNHFHSGRPFASTFFERDFSTFIPLPTQNFCDKNVHRPLATGINTFFGENLMILQKNDE